MSRGSVVVYWEEEWVALEDGASDTRRFLEGVADERMMGPPSDLREDAAAAAAAGGRDDDLGTREGEGAAIRLPLLLANGLAALITCCCC